MTKNLSKFSVFALSLFSIHTKADCSFKTSDYISELSDPSQITSIDINIPNSKKWVKNSLEIITDNSENIKSKNKKKFKSSLSVTYKFGKCDFKAKVRQSGDWKDHIKFEGTGNPISSLDISLLDGNILNAVSFKLLIPDTRKSENETLATIILRYLGFIAPETFLVPSSVNDVSTLYLFQENSEKEMLERNFKREGPILEGDEELLWDYKGYEVWELYDVSLSRLSNKKWAEKGETSAMISLRAFLDLQNAYLNFLDDGYLNGSEESIYPNNGSNSIFSDYAFVVFSMNGIHALRTHNRKFYFNAIEEIFEPIYYDGNILIDNFIESDQVQKMSRDFLYGISRNNIISYIDKLKSDEGFKNISDAFNMRNGANNASNKITVESAIQKTVTNMELLLSVYDKNQKNKLLSNKPSKNLSKNFLNKINFHNLDQKVFELKSYTDKVLLIENKENNENIADKTEIINLISRNTFKDKRSVLIYSSETVQDKLKSKSEVIEFLNGHILLSDGIKINADNLNKTISISQKTPTDWVVFNNISLEDWSVDFNGLVSDNIYNSSQRFNLNGVTGCLNFYKTTFINSKIKISNGQCEDSLNIISSSGDIDKIEIFNSFADAIDIDFSKVSISNLKIKNAGNDCLDVSGGSYDLNQGFLTNCFDKGVSVGEKSTFNINNLNIINANIGVSSKDLSITKINKMNANDVVICAEAFQKKQEFGGGKLVFEDIFDCVGEIIIDESSNILFSEL